MIRIASDIGGTFTDVVLAGRGRLTSVKVLTTPQAPEAGLLEGIDRVLAEVGVEPEQVDQLIHGTTLATNALIERRGAKTVQIATLGFRDVLEMAHENRFDQYDLSIDRAPPLIARQLRWEVEERLAADGRVLKPLDEAGVRRLAARLADEGVESVALTFLHAYADPRHERRAAEIIAETLPELPVSLSSEVSPEIREYERFATTCANAYVRPLMGRYLTALAAQVEHRGFGCPLLLVTSGGDLTDLATAVDYPVRLVESGPAGGAVLAAQIARHAGLNRVLALDMGGTTAKLCLIDDGQPQTTRSFEVGRVHEHMKGSGFPIRIPAVELVEIGSGGGSIARLDELGRLQVGPRSSGSVPGPVCYGRGGEAATVTDADAALGRIDPGRFSGGVDLDVRRAAAALEAQVGEGLGLNADLAAFAVAEIVDENMAAAARVHAAESGKALEGRTLIAFGGAAPLHATRVAQKLGIDRVLIPAHAGVGSAVGFLHAATAFEQARSLFASLDHFDPERVERALDDMEAHARALLGDGAYRVERRAYMRYRGQGHEIAVAVDVAAADRLQTAFLERYAELFGRTIPGVPIEALTWLVRVERIDALAADAAPSLVQEAKPASAPRTADIFDATAGERRRYALVERSELEPGFAVDGPLLVLEDQTTTVAPVGWRLEVVAEGDLMLTWEEKA